MSTNRQLLILIMACFVLIASFEEQAQAQSLPPSKEEAKDKFSVKALYADVNGSLFFRSAGGGLTLVNQKDFIFSARYRKATVDSPHKPADFRFYRPNTGGSGSGGGGIFGPFNVISYPSSGSGSGSSDECRIGCKDYKIFSLLAGKMLYSEGMNTRLSVESGLTFLSIDEAVDFVEVNNQGYTFRQDQNLKVGASFRAGIEFPFSRFIGFSSKLDFTMAKEEYLLGLELGLIAGFLR